MAKKVETYQKAMDRLRVIISEMENEEIEIDVLADRVKEASELIKVCKDKLYKIDEDVKKILEEIQ